MNRERGRAPSGFEWAVAARPLVGGLVSGDRHLCAPVEGGMLAAVIDGLGHGPEAALAAEAAVETLSQEPGAPVDALLRRCHEALRKTRGAAITLASLAARGEVTWGGIGNVEGVLLRDGIGGGKSMGGVTPRGGVVGYQMPSVRTATHAFLEGDLLILASDGIRSDFSRAVRFGEPPEQVAVAILEGHGRANDDALVLVVRLGGGAGSVLAGGGT